MCDAKRPEINSTDDQPNGKWQITATQTSSHCTRSENSISGTENVLKYTSKGEVGLKETCAYAV